MTPEPRSRAQSTAASVPTGREPSPPPAPKGRPRPRPTYKGKEKQMETLRAENAMDNSPDVIRSQSLDQPVEHSSRRASNKRDREDAGTETPVAKKKKTTRALEIVEEPGFRPIKKPIGRPRKAVKERPPISPTEVAAGGSTTEALAGADGQSNTISAGPATVDSEHTPRRHSARVAARPSGAVVAAS